MICMKRVVVGLGILLMLFLSGCDLPVYRCRLEKSREHSEDNLSRFYLVDLNGDSKEESVVTRIISPQHTEITVRDANFEVYSQLNFQEQVNRISFWDVNNDGEEELFISGIDQNEMIFIYQIDYTWKKDLKRTNKPLFETKRCGKFFEGRQSGGAFSMVGMGDTDDDGFDEYFLFGSAGFECYPRGLWVIDGKTGKEKWNYQLAGNYSSFYYEDLDGDGEKEFLISTSAAKNQNEIINGTDDRHSYILIINRAGKLVYQEELSRGFSLIRTFIKDIDQDGIMEILAVKKTWGGQHELNGVYKYNWQKGHLKLQKERQFEQPFARRSRVFWEDTDGDGLEEIFLIDNNQSLKKLNSNLEIEETFDKVGLHKLINIIDIDRDGKKELLALNNEGNLIIMDSRLNIRAQCDEQNLKDNHVLVYDPGYGEDKEIVTQSNGNFTFYSYRQNGLINVNNLRIILILLLLSILVWIITKYYRHRFCLYFTRKGLELVHEGFIIIDHRNRIRYSNQYWHILTNTLKKDDDLSELDVNLINVLRNHIDTFRNSPKINNKFSIIDNETNLDLEVEISKLRKRRKWLLARLSDKTDLVKMQEKAEWAETARGLSHGIRKHMNNILLATEQIKETDDGQVKAMSQIIIGEIKQLKYFVKSFQRFTEINKLQLQVIDTNELMREYLDNLMPDLPARIRIISEIEYDLPDVAIDKIRFFEVLNNLVNNAVEAIEEKGKIIIQAYRWEDSRNKQKVCFEVSDTGHGIETDLLNSIMMPYFTTKEGGTGIGLPLVKKMIETFKGKIEIDSKIDVGTTVRMIIPAVVREKQ